MENIYPPSSLNSSSQAYTPQQKYCAPDKRFHHSLHRPRSRDDASRQGSWKRRIPVELLQACGPTLYNALPKRFSRCMTVCDVPVVWKQSSTFLLFEKGDKADVANYRPITLLPVLYKVFTWCILALIRRTLDESQPVEQAGFRRKFSMLDHIITCCRLIEVAQEYLEPLVLTFVDYKKAFDSVEPAKIWEALEEHGLDGRYTYILSESYSGCTTVFRPLLNDVEVAVEKGVRQGDPIAPNLFSACLEAIIRRCDWSNFGINIDGVRLNHLRFADDIVLTTRSPDDASKMLHSLNAEGSKAGLVINTTKTKVMRNAFSSEHPVLLQGTPLEDVNQYVYLGRSPNMRNDLKPEILRRRRGQAAFNSIKSVFEDTKNRKLRADLFNSTVLPALCYASETWTLTKSIENQLRSFQLALERRLVGLTLRLQRESNLHNSDVRAMSIVQYAVLHAEESKHRYAGHLMRCSDGRWSTATIRWQPRGKKRPRGRPPTRWCESLALRNNSCAPGSVKVTVHWSTKAQDRTMWKRSWDPRIADRRAEGRVAPLSKISFEETWRRRPQHGRHTSMKICIQSH